MSSVKTIKAGSMTIVSGKIKSKVIIHEKNYNAVACSFKDLPEGMQDCNLSQLTITDTMIRDTDTANWKGIVVNCIKHKNPKKKFINKYATHVMGKEILGHAVLFSSSKDFTNQMISNSMFPPKVTGWLQVGRQMPKEVKLTEDEKEKKTEEQITKKQTTFVKQKITTTYRKNESDDEYFNADEDFFNDNADREFD